jgi:hypothetical protein
LAAVAAQANGNRELADACTKGMNSLFEERAIIFVPRRQQGNVAAQLLGFDNLATGPFRNVAVARAANDRLSQFGR